LADVNIERVFEKGAHKQVPFTVKDHLKVEGLIETCGFADNLKPSTVSSEVVEILEKEGCIAFAHTNIPQGLLGIQSSNPVYGTALNPHNPKFISGGSSGGEGAMVASQASAFGLGSDLGGSSRIPAAFCGIYGYKPTGSKRLSIKGRVGPSGS
jgi:amidase